MDVATGLGTMILNTPLVYGVYCAPPFHISVILGDIHISVESREFLSKSMRSFRIFIEINIKLKDYVNSCYDQCKHVANKMCIWR